MERRGAKRVRSIQEYIAPGDCYQVVRSQKFPRIDDDPCDIPRDCERSTLLSTCFSFAWHGNECCRRLELVRVMGRLIPPIAGPGRTESTETEDWMLRENWHDEKEVESIRCSSTGQMSWPVAD